jgi:hypothetical protein
MKANDIRAIARQRNITPGRLPITELILSLIHI